MLNLRFMAFDRHKMVKSFTFDQSIHKKNNQSMSFNFSTWTKKLRESDLDIFLSIGPNWKDPLRIPNFHEIDTIQVSFSFCFRTTRTWEFNSTSPIRSMTFNMVLWGGPLYLLKLFDFIFNFITGWKINRTKISSFQMNSEV